MQEETVSLKINDIIRVKYIGEKSSPLSLLKGKIYDARILQKGWYGIVDESKENSNSKFKEACEKIEKRFPNITKKKFLVDVDGSLVQTYILNGKEIKVFDDYYVGAVYLRAETDPF